MHKKLRYTMPKVPLLQCKETIGDDRNDNNYDNHDPAPGISNVNVMAKRIAQLQRKRRQGYRRPAEKPLGGDAESSGSDYTDDSHSCDSLDSTLL